MDDQNTPVQNQPVTPPEHDEQEDLQEASRSTADYSQFIPPVGKQSKHHGHKALVVFLVLVVVAAIGFGGYWFFLRSDNKKTPAKTSNSQTSQQTSQTTSKIATTTKHYESTNFGLSFDYPSDWTVAETDTSNKIVVTSPVISLTDATGQQTGGKVLFTIDQKGNNLTMFNKGNAVAVLDSKKIAYTKPSGTQRAQTYLSFLQYAATSQNGALDGVYVTGDYGYQKGQAIPMVDIAKVDPLLRITFVQCANKACSGTTTALSIQATSWNEASFSTPLENMLKSLVVQ